MTAFTGGSLLLTLDVLIILSVGVSLGAFAQDTRSARSDGDPEMMRALPTLKAMPGFSGRRVNSFVKGAARLGANRKRDQASLDVTIVVEPTAEQAQKRLLGFFFSSSGAKPHAVKSGPSGRVIGQEMWCWEHPPDKPHRGTYSLAVRDGRSCAYIRLTLDVVRDEQGEPVRDKEGEYVRPLITPQDFRLVENQAIFCLDKLTEMGYTSKSPKPKS